MKRDLERGKPHKPKHAMHLIRLLLSGIAALRTGGVQVDVSEHRDELLGFKQPDHPFEAVYARALELDAEFRAALADSALPERPDVEAVDAFLIRARRSVV